MKRILNCFYKAIIKEDGASIIETLVALAFIGVVSTSFLSLAITARKLSFKHRVQNELGQYAGMVTEEMLKDYTISSSVKTNTSVTCANGSYESYDEYYCGCLLVKPSTELGVLVNNFLIKNSPSSCKIEKTAGKEEYKVTLTGEAFGKAISAERILKLE